MTKAASRTVREAVDEFDTAFDGNLGAAPGFKFETAMTWMSVAACAWANGADMRKVTRTQIEAFSKL
jgi:hypothetical protein